MASTRGTRGQYHCSFCGKGQEHVRRLIAGPGAGKTVISRAIALYQMNKPRVIRIHLQHIRTAWVGPDGLTNASSPYIQYLLADDKRMGLFIQALKDGSDDVRKFAVFALGKMGSAAGDASVALQNMEEATDGEMRRAG